MAIFKSGIITQGSGSIGGLTLTRNRGGMIMRARAIPVNPNTPAQNIVRGAMATLSNRWVTVLTQVQRDAWDTYALNVPLTGPTGDPRNVGGIGMYNRTNVPGIVAAFPIVDDAPTIFDLGSFTPLTAPTATDAGEIIGFAFTNTDEWANEDGAALLVWGSRPVNPGINFFTGPYQFAGLIAGNSATPPTSPAAVTNPFPFGVGPRIFFRVTAMRADGRYSNQQRLTALGV